MRPSDDTQGPSFDETLAGTGGASALDDDAPLRRGDAVGRYVVLEPLGRGANGVVYKAFDPQLDRAVALKLLLAGGTTRSRAKLTAEAQALARVAHPNVIAIHDVGTVDRRVFYAMELVDGLPLSHWREEASPSTEQILDVFRQAGAGLAAAHAAGLVHRDFKPDNVLVGKSGRVRVLDFGLALPTDDLDTTDEREPSRIAGTPGYMAPEQFGGGIIDARTDQFSFCVALHEALTGDRPFHGETLAALGYAVMQGERADVDTDDVPGHVMDVIERGLALEPEQRFPSMDALLQALTRRSAPRWGRAALGGATVLALATGAAYGLGRNVATTPVDPCSDTGAPIDAVWTETRRDEVAAAFARSGAYNAASMHRRVEEALDDYASRWREAAETSCTMSEVDRTFDKELAFRSRLCIDQALEAFEQHLEGLESPTAELVQSSLDGVGRLPVPAECVNRSWLQLDVEIPSDPAQRRPVEALLTDVDEARGLDPLDCLERVETLELRARELEHRPPLARVLGLRADCEYKVGRRRESRQSYEAAYTAALSSSYDWAAIEAAADIAYIAANDRDELEVADVWLRQANALAARHSIEEHPIMHAVLNVRGILAARRGDHDDAIASFEKIVALTRGVPGSEFGYRTALINIGATLAIASKHRDALEYLEVAMSFSEAHYGPEHLSTAELRFRTAAMRFMLGDLESARTSLRAAVIAIKRRGGISRVGADANHVLAMVEHRLDNPEVALEHAREAYRQLSALDASDTSAAMDMLNTLSTIECQTGELDAAADTARELVEVSRLRGGPLDQAQALARLASVLLEQGKPKEARLVIEPAPALATSNEGRSELTESDVGFLLGSVLFELDDARALGVLEAAEAGLEDEGRRWAMSDDRLNLVSALSDRGRTDEARALLARVEAVLEDHPYPAEAVGRARELGARLSR